MVPPLVRTEHHCLLCHEVCLPSGPNKLFIQGFVRCVIALWSKSTTASPSNDEKALRMNCKKLTVFSVQLQETGFVFRDEVSTQTNDKSVRKGAHAKAASQDQGTLGTKRDWTRMTIDGHESSETGDRLTRAEIWLHSRLTGCAKQKKMCCDNTQPYRKGTSRTLLTGFSPSFWRTAATV